MKKKRLTKFIRAVILSAMASSLFTMPAFAAKLDDFSHIEGRELLDEREKEIVDNGLKNIPDYVVDYFNLTKGDFVFHSGLFTDYPNAYGLYQSGGGYNDISIRIDEPENLSLVYCLQDTVAHEVGHFIETKTHGYWTEEQKTKLTSLYNYWSKVSFACYNEHETYAVLYSWFVNDQMGLSDETKQFFEDTQLYTKRLIETKDQGPGALLANR